MSKAAVQVPRISRIYFDPADHELLAIVNEILENESLRSHQKRLLDPYLHPHGIKELSAQRESRVAYAIIQLLRSLENGEAGERLQALRSVKEEALSSAITDMRINTARVQLQLMKELVRSGDDPVRQLELAHDFRQVSGGKPGVVRRLLDRYHLLEMPESGDQLTFDSHVHDASTKGRKTPTHLVMDAWIKGIKQITVVYYHFVRPEVAAELLEAAEIMGITVRIGVELWARHRAKFVQLIWVPRGFSDPRDFLSFLNEPVVNRFMKEGEKSADYFKRHVLALLDNFNKKHLKKLNSEFEIKLPPLEVAPFLAFVGAGQASTLHLAEFIYHKVQPLFKERLTVLRAEAKGAAPDKLKKIEEKIAKMAAFYPEVVFQNYLKSSKNPEVPDPHNPQTAVDLPARLSLSPKELLSEVNKLPAGYRINMNLTGLYAPEVLEVLYDCEGLITHLELMNLKDYLTKKINNYEGIDELRQAINGTNIIRLKHIVRRMISDLEQSSEPDKEERLKKMRVILHDLPRLQSFYRESPLKAQLGSDSTGRSRQLHGMGLVVLDSLAPSVQRKVRKENSINRRIVPIKAQALHVVTYGTEVDKFGLWGQFWHRLPIINRRSLSKIEEKWQASDFSYSKDGNVATLGGIAEETPTPYTLEEESERARYKIPLRYMRSDIINWLKVLGGFIPAFLSFFFTKDWWLLAYFGAIIWFAITGVRNVMQSVLAGRGISNAPLLHWTDFVSWGRVADSLLYSGISVPLLDWLVNGVILKDMFGVTTSHHVFILYTVNSLVNGVYITSHNFMRGLPKSAAVGNFFRSILSIPIALGMSHLAGRMLLFFGIFATIGEANTELQFWAAMISKLASDLVAAVIEGLADRGVNMRLRKADYKLKLSQIFDNYAKLEAVFPEKNLLAALEKPQEFYSQLPPEQSNLEHIAIVNSLDMLYFWAYQPRAHTVFHEAMNALSGPERQIILRSMSILDLEQRISQLLVERLVGKDFNKALAFYLGNHKRFMRSLLKRYA